MANDPETPQSFSPGRRWSFGFNVVVAVVALFAIVVMVNYLAARHYWRWHWSRGAARPLSPLTLSVLGSLTNQVHAVVFFSSEEDLFGPINDLLKEYSYQERQRNRSRSPRSLLHVETVDYYRNPGRAKDLKTRYQLPPSLIHNFVLFESQGRQRLVQQVELSEYDFAGMISGQTNTARRTGFKGEMLFTSALVSVTETRSLKACFLQGHGEHDPTDDTGPVAYGQFARVLREKNIALDLLRLSGTNEVPPDCSLLIVAGATDPLLPSELEKIDRFLTQGGRLLSLHRSMTRATGLETLVARWGVEVGENVVLDRGNSYTGQDLVVTNFSGHPIVRPLLQSQLYLVLPRSVSKRPTAARTADAPRVDELVYTSLRGTAVTDLRNGVAYEHAGKDPVGAIPLMVAVEKGSIQGVSADRGSTRLVVIGESLFLGNQALGNLANRDFASLAVSWLLDRPQLLGGIGPRPVKNYRVILTRNQMSVARWLLLAGLPGSVLGLGLLVWLRRRQ